LNDHLAGDCFLVLAFTEKGFERIDANFQMLWNSPLWCGVVIQSIRGNALEVVDVLGWSWTVWLLCCGLSGNVVST
jgi:hypothetical protein